MKSRPGKYIRGNEGYLRPKDVEIIIESDSEWRITDNEVKGKMQVIIIAYGGEGNYPFLSNLHTRSKRTSLSDSCNTPRGS